MKDVEEEMKRRCLNLKTGLIMAPNECYLAVLDM